MSYMFDGLIRRADGLLDRACSSGFIGYAQSAKDSAERALTYANGAYEVSEARIALRDASEVLRLMLQGTDVTKWGLR